MPTQVFRSTDASAPSLSGTAGSLIALLDAVLVNGYGSVSVSGISRVGATATLVASAAHNLKTGEYAQVSGADQSDYNGVVQVTVIDNVTVTYAVSSSATTPATGTITIKRAPLGWSKVYSATNKAVYRAPTGNRFYLRIVDDGSLARGFRQAMAAGYESMSDVDTGTGKFPTDAQRPYSLRFVKSPNSNSTPVRWRIFGDQQRFWFFPEAGAYTTPHFFGDINSLVPGDAYATVIGGQFDDSNEYNYATLAWSVREYDAAIGVYCARHWDQAAQSVNGGLGHKFYFVNSTNFSYLIGTANLYPGGWPDPVTGALRIEPVWYGHNGFLRGLMPGLVAPGNPDPYGDTFGASKIHVGAGPVFSSGRDLEVVAVSSNGNLGIFYIDTTGPWS